MKVKLRADGFMVPVDLEAEGKRLSLSFGYCPALLEEVKAMHGARWHGYDERNPRKVWTVDDNARNWFRINYLRWAGRDSAGQPKVPGTFNPYERYDAPLVKVDCKPRLFRGNLLSYYDHQPEGVSFVITRRQCVLAWEPGVGKTLIIGTAMEWAKDKYGWNDEDFLYVCKNGALFQVIIDFRDWGIRVHPKFMGYEQLVSTVGSWQRGKPAPKFVVFDESTMIKNPGAKRSEAAMHVANAVRQEWGPDGFIVCMTGSPAPKDPSDWWHQVEVACPGFLREGDQVKFRKRLAIIEKATREDGNSYPKLISWLDDDRKCGKCGQLKDALVHSEERILTNQGHSWHASKNEVAAIYDRLKGLVSIKFKKDCLSLPRSVKRVIRVKPSQQTLNAAKLIAKAARGAAQALTLLRELSDGFQYQDVEVDRKQCPMCGGSGTMISKIDPENPCGPPSDEALRLGRLEDVVTDCDQCQGAGDIPVTQRNTRRVPCPKDEVLEDLIDEHQDIGRLVVYAGFTGSVDRVVDIFGKAGWHVLRVDGRGWTAISPGAEKHLPNGKAGYEAFRYDQTNFPKVAFVAQASTAAHGLNFDNCPTIVYYSNDFNFENRIQGDERNMRGRIGETLKRTGRSSVLVVDIVHLESDALVLANHEKKRKLQALTLGEVLSSIEQPVLVESQA